MREKDKAKCGRNPDGTLQRYQAERTGNYTRKQYQILEVLCKGRGKDANGELIPCDMNHLLSAIPYETTRTSMYFSLRPLMRYGLIEKETAYREGTKVAITLYRPTELGMKVMGVNKPSYIEDPIFIDE
ncbi:hypothetical protein LJC19_04790 [Oxalobacter sp. OttesenSCG-928-P03]|nr:hypothetical protein [Oxalobacter sp. OttesenSCG-928-P03]